MGYLTLKDMEFTGQRAIVRVDYNVPMKEGRITDDKRIRESLPTLKYLLEHGCRQIILMSHFGRPDGKRNDLYSLKPVAEALGRLLGADVKLMDDCVDILLPEDRLILLENLRFHPEEEANDSTFAAKLALFADVYVNDAFGTCHRAHASVSAIAALLPSCAGFLLEKEIRMLKDSLQTPERPFVAIMGGAKITDKVKLIEHLLPKVDKLLLGGAMIFTFYKSQGKEIGTSLCEEEGCHIASKLIDNPKIILPKDVVISPDRSGEGPVETVRADAMRPGWAGLDIGPLAIEDFKEQLRDAKTIVWNGPMGLCEVQRFATGTDQLASYLAGLGTTVIIGGGDSAAAIARLGLEEKVTHVSTGGGASLELLEGKTLPGVLALEDSYKIRQQKLAVVK
jgi:phosphoglycerate kinase